MMKDDSYTLSEVTIKGRNLGAKIKNDTIEFSPDVFKNGSEQNMSDVIKKLPGMTVDESGNVSYQGKKIDKFLVNGEDVLSTGGHALKTLSADFASGVELLSNYNDGNVGNSFNSKETTALNLINKDFHNKWAGNFTEGGGMKNKFDSKNSALKMGNKVSASIIANANNTNEAVFSIMDYLNANGGLTGVKTTNGFAQLSLSSAERNVLMPSNDEYKRTSGIGNVNLTLKPSSHYKATIGVIHNEMDAKSALSTEQHIKMAQENIRKSTEENGKKRGSFSSFNLSQKWDVNQYTSLRFQTKLAYSDMRNSMSIMDYYNNNSDRNTDNDKNKGFNALQQVSLNSLIGKGLLYGSVDFAFSKSDRNLDILSSYELPIEYTQADGSYYIDRGLKKLNVAGAVGYVFPISHKINLKWELSTQNYDSWIDQNVDSEHLNSHNFGIYGGLMKNKGLFRFDAGVRFSDYGNNTNINGLATKSVIKWEPSFATELRFSQQHSVAFGLSYKYVPTDIEALSRLSVINSYDEVTDASSYSRLGNNALNMNIAYKLYSLYSRTIIFMYLTYEKADNTEMLNYQNDGLLHSQNYMDGGKKETVNATLYANKGLGNLPIDAKLTTTFLWNRNEIAYNFIPCKMLIGNLKTDLGFVSRFKIPFNVEVDGLYNKLTNKVTDLNIDSSDKEFGGTAKLIFAKNKFASFVTGKWNKIENTSGSKILRDIDFSISY
ncbi:TonB-dependent receptor, partial [Prevotella sp.]